MDSSAPPEWYSFSERKSTQKDLLRDRKRRGGLCNAGAGHRDFDSPGQISEKSIEITKLVCTPSLCASRSRKPQIRSNSDAASSSFLVSQLSPRPPPLPREGESGGEFLLKGLSANLKGGGVSSVDNPARRSLTALIQSRQPPHPLSDWKYAPTFSP
jgi:hypothetical protein